MGSFTPLPKTTENIKKTDQNVIETIEKPLEVKKTEATINDITDNVETKKPKIYREFLRKIKAKKAITAIALAEILGVHRTTISKWLDTPQARIILSNQIDYHFNKITESKDWKAHAYMIDRATGKQDNNTNVQVNILDGLTIVRR